MDDHPSYFRVEKRSLAGPVDDWFKPAGAPRKAQTAVYSPPSGGYGSTVWPERFTIRWIPGKSNRTLTFRIEDEAHRPLWPAKQDERASASSITGELISEDARRALLDYRKTGGRALLTLISIDSEGEEADVQFSIISEPQEAALKDQLKMCGNQSGLMPYICRAYYLRQVSLYTEAAEEYDAALKVSPASVQLQLHAIAAHRLTGNYAREQEVTRKLPKGTKVPE